MSKPETTLSDDMNPTNPLSQTTPEMRAEARQLDGLFAGSLRPEEYKPPVDAGLLRFTYEGAGGLMGLAKLRTTELCK